MGIQEPDPVSVISVKGHDLATPLTTITGTLDYLEKAIAKSQVPDIRWVHILQKESKRMSRMVRDLLFYSAIQRNAVRYVFTSVELIALLENVRSSVMALRPDVTVLLEHDKNRTSIDIIGDGEKLHQAFLYIAESLQQPVSAGGNLSVTVRKRTSRIIITFLMKYRAGSPDSDPSAKKNPDISMYLSEKIIKSHNGQLLLPVSTARGKEITVMLTAVKQKGGYI